MLSRLVAAGTVGACLVACGPSQAAIISYTFAAELVTTYGASSAFIRANVTGRFGYDTSVRDDSPSPTFGVYVGAAGALTLDGLFEPPAFGPPQLYGAVRTADDASSVPTDILSWSVRYDIGGPQLNVFIEFYGTSSLLPSDALPTSLPLDQIRSGTLQLDVIDVIDDREVARSGLYRLTALSLVQVPEPTGLFGAAMLGLVALAHARRTRR